MVKNIHTVTLPECCDKDITSSGISGARNTESSSFNCKDFVELIGKGGCTLL